MGTTLWTDEISGIDGMMTEWTPQWQWAAACSKPWCQQQRKISHQASTFGSLARRTLTSWKIWGAVVTPTTRPVVTAQRDTQVPGCAYTSSSSSRMRVIYHNWTPGHRVCTGFTLGYAASGGPSLLFLFSSMRGRQQLSCPVLRPPSGPNARPQGQHAPYIKGIMKTP